MMYILLFVVMSFSCCSYAAEEAPKTPVFESPVSTPTPDKHDAFVWPTENKNSAADSPEANVRAILAAKRAKKHLIEKQKSKESIGSDLSDKA